MALIDSQMLINLKPGLEMNTRIWFADILVAIFLAYLLKDIGV